MIFQCDALAVKRADTLGKYFLDPKKDRLNLQDVLEFIKSADLTNHSIPDGHLTNLNPPTIRAAGLELLGAGSPTPLGGTAFKKK